MALTFGMKVTGLCSGVVGADRKRIDTVLINANTTMTDIPYHLQTLLIESRYVVPPPAGLSIAAPLGSYKGRVDVERYKVPEENFTAWDLNGAIVKVCEGGEPITDAHLDVAPAAATGEICDGDWSDLHWVLDMRMLADAVGPGVKIDPNWRQISSLTLAVFEMLKGRVCGADPYYPEYAGQILKLEGEQHAQTYTDAWLYEYVSPTDSLLLQVDRAGVISHIACAVPAGGAVSAVLLNEGAPGTNPLGFEHMLAYYDLLGSAGTKPLPAVRKKLVYDDRVPATALGDGAFCMPSMF
jgi:hypothetical protein